ncbi:MAG TPA: LysR family transcriptional regulator [Candidatus Binatia bacterium]|jgi:DNA-binding transcriptional LysR family regulator
MTLHQLRIFSSIAKYLNVTKASAELHISQPSVSQQVKLLQQEYGVTLYRKNSRGIQLTDEGRLFLKEIEPILNQFEKLKSRFGRKRTDRASGTLRIGGSQSPSVSFLPMLSTIFKETHPLVAMTLRTDTSRGIERLVLNGEIEIGVVTNPSHHPSVAAELYGREKLVAFASTKHPCGKKDTLTLAELTQAPLVIKKGKEGPDRVWETIKHLEQQGYKLNIVMYCESPEAAKAAVRSGIGLGILFSEIVAPDVRRGELKIIKIPELKMTVDTYIVFDKRSSLSPHAQDFLTLLHEWPRKTQWVRGPLPPISNFSNSLSLTPGSR